MKKKGLILLLFLLATVFTVQAQDTATVSGKVLDQNGRPVVKATVVYQGEEVTSTNKEGFFKVKVIASRADSIGIYRYGAKLTYYKIRSLKIGEKVYLKLTYNVKRATTKGKTIVYSKKEHEHDGKVKINLKPLTTLPNTSGGIETLIKSQIGVTSSNELSSQFNVRGGNFDENLIYVNGFQIYKPQLVHSGNQEGLSMPHPDLIKNMNFYAGGFAARYGDKLSSVLDVEYKRPKKFGLTLSGGLLGGSIAMENKAKRFTALTGIRYKTAKFLLNTLDIEGQYNPKFFDAQVFLSYDVNDLWTAHYFGHIAQNTYVTKPQSRETSFGTVQNALKIFVGMDGTESLRYNTFSSGASMRYDDGTKYKLNFSSSVFYSMEKEYNDVLGAYRLSVLDNNLGSEKFGEEVGSLGNGFFINHARNDLDVLIYNFEHLGMRRREGKKTHFTWGVKAQFEDIQDKFLEWDYSDSSDYNITGYAYREDSIFLNRYERSQINLISQRYSGFIQGNTRLTDSSKMKLTYGVRAQHWSVNQELFVSPRVQFSFEPNRRYNSTRPDSLKKKDMSFRAAAGFYHQSPFYRELRDPKGQINKSLKAQQSIHYVVGADWLFKAWGRKFKFLSEMYYKQLSNVVPYYYSNIRVRYLAENSGKGYAAGWDTRINGEFIKGLESWVTVSLLKTSEQIDYINQDGEEANSGFIRRPTDRRVNVAIMFQDELPNDKSFRMNLNFLFGTSLPYYLGGYDRFREGNDIPSYKRVDIGFTKVLKEPGQKTKSKKGSKVKSAYLSLDVFNLLDIQNVVSYLWIKDVNNNIYGIPNFLTSRTINLRFTVKI